MKEFIKKISSSRFNIFLSFLLLIGVSISIVTLVFSAAPDPGHTWSEIELGNLPVTSLNNGTGAGADKYWEGDGTWSSVSGSLIDITSIQNPTTSFTPVAGTGKLRIELWGGGGAGGSCTNVAGCAAGGGGAGGYLRYEFVCPGTPANCAGPYTVSVGAGGSAVAGATGGAGGNTTFNTGSITLTAYGGAGGTTAAGSTLIKFTAGGAGGAISTNGDINGGGAPGGPGVTSTVATTNMSGFGGATSLGGAGVEVGGNVLSTAIAGNSAVANTGSGGSGARTGTTTAALGGAGAAGRIVIWQLR